MADEPAGDAEFILKFKVQLLEALSGDPDLVLQHCHSSQILTQREYDRVNAITVRTDQARDLLDYILKKDPQGVQKFLDLLKSEDLQQAFPKLAFLKTERPTSKGLRAVHRAGEKRKRKNEAPEDEVPPKLPCKPSSRRVSEKQLMLVARHIGRNWKEVGRVALEIGTVKLEQIEEQYPDHRERVFRMLRSWTMREREKASATRIHSLLSQEENNVDPGSIDFLLEED